MYESFKITELPEENILRLSTEVPDGETTVSCTNLLETLNFLRETIAVFFSRQLCNEGSVGTKISLFFVVIIGVVNAVAVAK